jgi:hypothetical protein
MRHPENGRLNPFPTNLRDKASYRFYMARPYFLPLNMSSSSIENRDPGSVYEGFDFSDVPLFRNGVYSQIGYATNGFWIHVSERYLGGQISRVSELYDRLDEDAMYNVTNWVDYFLDQNDGAFSGLEHVLPQFLAEYEGWWDDEVGYNCLTEELWHTVGFNGCEELRIDDVTTSATLELEVVVYSGRCIDVVLAQPLAELSPELQFAAYSTANAEIAKQLQLAVARIRNADALGEAPLPPSNASSGDVTCFDQVERGLCVAAETAC